MSTPMTCEEVYQRIVGFKPNPMQEVMFNRITSGDCAALLKAPTASGKTESVLVPALMGLLNGSSSHRLFLILPSRSLVDDQTKRVGDVLERLSQQVSQELALVVDTGSQSYRKAWKNGSYRGKNFRHLYDGNVVLTTLDKFLYRFFGFGESFKNYIFPFRIHYGARKPLFCFDEAHTYENVAFTNFVNLVYMLAIEKGHDVVVMTATMPKAYAGHLKFLETVDFVDDPANSQALSHFYQRPHEGKTLEYVPAKEEDLVETLVKQAGERYQNGRRVIVTAELVKDAVEVYEQLSQQFGADVLLYHGRIPDEVDGHQDKGRVNIYAEVKRRDSANEGYLLVTTSAIEVGCDLNAHTLITELCNPDQLIQRAGRCNRKCDIPDARVIVVGEKIKSFLSDLNEDAGKTYVKTLEDMHGKPLDTSKILSHISIRPQVDYRVQMMFDMLYEYVYEANQVYRNLYEKGLVVTRSWEPCVTICTGFDDNNRPLNPVSVNISSLIARQANEITQGCSIYRRYYEGDRSHIYQLEPMTTGWYCAYFLDLYLQVPSCYFDACKGYINLPKVFENKSVSSYRKYIKFTPNGAARGSKDTKGLTLWYLCPPIITTDETSDQQDQMDTSQTEDESE